jgi:hypothetical protein
MKRARLVVVDWTRSAARIGVFGDGMHGWQLDGGIDMPARLGVRLEEGQLHVVAGEEANELREDAGTLIFEHPVRDLPRMDDSELQSFLILGFWRALLKTLKLRGILRAGEEADGYLIPPHYFQLSLLQSFRESCADERPLRFIGTANEAAALVLGFLRSRANQLDEGLVPPATSVTACLVTVADEQTVDVVCFDYERTTSTNQRILIRDFFQTDCAEFAPRLRDCDWLGSFSQLVVVEDPTLPESALSAINTALQAMANGVICRRQQLPHAWQLKLLGGSHIALCASGRAPDAQEYEVAHASHIGLQIDQEYLQPVVAKAGRLGLTEVPHFAAQVFRLRGRTGNDLRLNFFSGYSTRIADAVPLGHTMLSGEDLAQLKEAGAFTAAVRLDTPSSGEFLVGLMPENRLLHRQHFMLPGLAN